MNIVVVEDHDALREITVQALRSMNHEVVGVACAEALVDEIDARKIHLLVLDLNLPGESGVSVARRLRTTQPELGIIMLTARTHISDRVAGYESGADIYLTKPTSLQELLAAVSALGLRLEPKVEPHTDMVLNYAALSLQGTVASLSLSLLEACMLVAFCRAQNQRLEHWQLMDISITSAEKIELNKNALEAKVARLRKKLVYAGAVNQPLIAIRGHGYQLCVRLIII